MFLDFNRIKIHDDDKWFDNLFVCGQVSNGQIFVESVFEKHVDWMNLIQNDDNFRTFYK